MFVDFSLVGPSRFVRFQLLSNPVECTLFEDDVAEEHTNEPNSWDRANDPRPADATSNEHTTDESPRTIDKCSNLVYPSIGG